MNPDTPNIKKLLAYYQKMGKTIPTGCSPEQLIEAALLWMRQYDLYKNMTDDEIALAILEQIDQIEHGVT